MEQTPCYIDLPKPVDFEVGPVETPLDDQVGVAQGHYCNFSFEYFNGLSKEVTVVERSGLKVEIPSSRTPMFHDFIVRASLTVGSDINLTIDHLLNSQSQTSRLLAQIVQNGRKQYRFGQCKFSLDFHISLSDIESNGGNLYLTDLDIVVSTLKSAFIAFHPYSEIGIRNRIVEEEEAVNDPNTFGYALRIIDNQGEFGDRYININGVAYRVPAVKDSSLTSGVYLASTGPAVGDVKFPRPQSKRYEFSEAEEALGLYKSANEAKVLGDEALDKKREIENLSFEIKEKELGLKRREQELKEQEQRARENRQYREHLFHEQKEEFERKRAKEERERKEYEIEMERRRAKLKEEIADFEHQRKLEQLDRKHEYERRYYDRKDTSEIIKFLPVIITGVMSLIVAFDKIKG